MRNATMMQALVLRALVQIPVGATIAAVHEYIEKYTGVRMIHPYDTFRNVLKKGLVQQHTEYNKNRRTRPHIHYSITDAGLEALAAQTLPGQKFIHRRIARMQRERLALRTRAQAVIQAPSPAATPAPERRPHRFGYRPLTLREMKAQGLKRWQM